MPWWAVRYLNTFSIRQRQRSQASNAAAGAVVSLVRISHHRLVVLEQGQLAGGAVAGDLDGLVGQGDRLGGPGGVDPEAADGYGGGFGQRPAAPGQPVHAGVAAGG